MKVHQTLEWLNLLSLGTKGLKPRQQSVYNQGSVKGGGWRGQHLNSQQHSLTTLSRHCVSIKPAYTVPPSCLSQQYCRYYCVSVVQAKKFGCWRKNSAANCYPRNQHFIQYYSDFTSLFLKGTFFIDPVKKQYITFYGIYSLVGFSTWYCQLCLTNTVHVRLRLEVIQNFISGCN